ncbi:drebrin-like a isoform X2 [Brachyhypopomus gauderio]
MVQELNSGKVMYAFCRVQEPGSGVPKFVLINWTGEGVKVVRKGTCANHVPSMANFLRGAHVTINARSDDDVEPDAIMDKVAKAAGVNYNLHKESNRFNDAVPHGPVGSVHQKVSAVKEIQNTNKDDFWAEMEREEQNRRRQERNRAEQERQRMEEERRNQDTKEAAERERRQKEIANQIDQQRAHQKISALNEIQNTNKDDFWAKMEREEQNRRRQERNRAEQERQQMEEERRNQDVREAAERERRQKEIANQIDQQRLFENKQEAAITKKETEEVKQEQPQLETRRGGMPRSQSVQIANEAAALISQRKVNPRDVFKQKEKSLVTNGTPSYGSQPGRLKSPFITQQSDSSERPTWEVSQYSSPANLQSAPTKYSPTESAPTEVGLAKASPVYSGSAVPAFPHQDPGQQTNVLIEHFADHSLTHQQDEVSDEEWQDSDEGEPVKTEPLYHHIYENFKLTEDSKTAEASEDLGAEQNICARALYDYQAGDDTEITFDPDDIISGIEMIDEGWWRGFGPDGHFGMFPANYVELL